MAQAMAEARLTASDSGGDWNHQPARDHGAGNKKTGKAAGQRHCVAGHARGRRGGASLPKRLAIHFFAAEQGCHYRHTSVRSNCAGCLENIPAARHQAEAGEVLFGNIDSFLLWKLTGATKITGLHATDVTNASRNAS